MVVGNRAENVVAAAWLQADDARMVPPAHEPTRWTAATVYPDMWVDPDGDPREVEVEPAGERATLVGFLRRYRLTLELKCAGLEPEQLARRSVPPSTMSLLGLIRQLADVERGWFRRVMAGIDAPPLYYTGADREGDWDGAVPDESVVQDAWRRWHEEVAFADEFVRASADLEVRALNVDTGGVPLRWVLVHLIEEYARHCGHADLLRRIDGRVGQ